MLGPIRAVVDGSPVDIGGLRAEILLALLATRANTPVSTDALIDELWAGEPPDGAATTLRSYVSRLRASLGPAAAIERLTGGYVLRVPEDAVDLARFEALVQAGRELQQRGRQRRAAAALGSALGLWRGEPFAGLPLDGLLAADAARLEELRLNTLEQRIDADLELRRGSDLIDELEALLAQHPFRERLWRHLMLALYRAGRQADALAAYRRARQALDEQLGIDPGPELQALEAAILRQDVPGPAGDAVRSMHDPPRFLNAFVGRRDELQEVRALLFRSRLVTLIGVGGVGKTRLAIEAATRATADIVDGVAFVDLAAVSDPGLVAEQVVAALGVEPAPDETQNRAVARELAASDVLLVLDNCEHVRDAAAGLASDLLRAAPDLRILATSREVLDVDGEASFPLAPLEMPAEDAGPEALRQSDAVRLLIDRATLQRHGLRLDDAAYQAAARICRELDGLPLAIELAAARTKALSLEEIAVRIRDRFAFLVSWRRLTTARHRTLREAMDWSFQLLEPDEQALLAQMSVFPAGATLHSVAAVCLGGDAGTGERLVERLVDASLVAPTEGRRETRYRLLETVRQYAAEQLDPADLEDLRRRHAAHVLALSRSAKLSLETVGHGSSFEAAGDELPSIRAAIQWASDADPSLAIEIACSLERFWVSNRPREGLATYTRLLEVRGVPDELRARLFRCRGGCSYVSGAFETGLADYEAALAIHRRLGQRDYQAHMLLRVAMEAQRAGDHDRARGLLDEAALVGGDVRFRPDTYVAMSLASDLAFDEGRIDDSLALLGQTAEHAGEAGDGWWRAGALVNLAQRSLAYGRTDLAGPAAREALRWADAISDRQSTIYCVGLLAWEAAASGRHDRAGRLWGGLEAEVERGEQLGQWAAEQDAFRAQLDVGGDAFLAAVAAGQALPLQAVVAEALSSG